MSNTFALVISSWKKQKVLNKSKKIVRSKARDYLIWSFAYDEKKDMIKD